jgi:MoaA/NifB/PqqE/SkfB family radical SAM enzyme
MNRQLFNIVRILFDPRITSTPARVLRELRARGKQRVPGEVQGELEGGMKKGKAVAFIRHWLDGELLSRHRGQWVLNSFLPPFPGIAFNRMFENLLTERRLSPVSAYLAVTAECPYRCWHCSHKNRRYGNLPTSDWISTIQELHALGVSIIGFTGGEPLARRDLPELVHAASRNGAATIVFTSGAGMDAETARRLKDAGLWAFCVSLDHPDPETCDALRGAKNVYSRAIEALRLGKKAGFYSMVGTVASRNLVDQHLHEALYLIAREHGAQELRLVEPMPCGNLAEDPEDTFLTPGHVERLRVFHGETNRKGRMPKVCAFNRIEGPEIFGCGAGTQHLFIDSAGEVCPCDFTPLSFGNVTQEPMGKIWAKMTEAMGNPRRHCFIQMNHKVISAHSHESYPLPYELSRKICAQVGKEALPDYFALVTGQSSAPDGNFTKGGKK